MAAKSTNTPATRKARSRSDKNNQIIHQLSPWEICLRSNIQAHKELRKLIDSLTEAEKEVVGHVCPFGDPINGIKEIRRLLGASAAKCKVIPFPVMNKRIVEK